MSNEPGTYTLDVTFGVGCCYGSFAIRRDGDEIATSPTMWLRRRACLTALNFMAYLEKIPEPERAKLEKRLNAVFDECEGVTQPRTAAVPDPFTETIIGDILRTRQCAARLKN